MRCHTLRVAAFGGPRLPCVLCSDGVGGVKRLKNCPGTDKRVRVWAVSAAVPAYDDSTLALGYGADSSTCFWVALLANVTLVCLLTLGFGCADPQGTCEA